MRQAEELNKQDSEELFSQLIGRVVINHEHINSLMWDLNSLLLRDIKGSLYWYPEEISLKELNDNCHNKVAEIAREQYFAFLQEELMSQKVETSELRGNIIKLLASFHPLFNELGEPFNDAVKLTKHLGSILKTENIVRNRIVHSTFDFSGEREELLNARVARRPRYKAMEVSKELTPTFKIRTAKISQKSFLEFIEFQSEAISAIELFNLDVRDDGYPFLTERDGAIDHEWAETALSWHKHKFEYVSEMKSKLTINQTNEDDVDGFDFKNYL